MEKKSLSIVPLGMQQDISVVQLDQQSAFEIRNMRITTTGYNTNLCLKNEKSNKKVENIDLDGVVLGCQGLSDYVILFIKHNNGTDSIVKVIEENGNLSISYLFSRGNLNFNVDNPIESIGIYENENIQKVYWVDGINSPRVINVCKTYTNDNSSQFDFIPILNNDKPLNLEVSPVFNSNASFTGGVIQYAISYFNKYGQQSPIIYQSPLYYTTDSGRGLNPDGSQKTSTSFKLIISNISTDWEYIRVYRIFRTSLDATPSVEYIGDCPSDSFYTSSDTSTLTSTNSTKIKYGIEGTYTGTGSLSDMMGDFNGKLKVDDLYPNIAIINSIGIHNPSPDTNKDFYIQYKNEEDDFQFLIPKDKIVKLQWEKAEDRFDLTKKYFISIGDEEDPFNYSSEEYITRIIDGVLIYDTGTTGTSVDPSELLFLGITDVSASTIAHKDGTLFLGNITDNKLTISEDIKKKIKDMSSLEFVLSEDNSNALTEDIEDTLNTQWVFNSNLLKSNKESTHFQYGEVYRFGVQFLSNKGTWSEVVYLGDLENNKRIIPYTYNDGIKNKPILKAEISIPQEIKQDYIGAKLVCVYPSIQDRNVLCQGIVCSTLYNVKDRNDNSPYVQSSWFARPEYSRYNKFDKAYMSSTEEDFHRGAPLEYRMVGSEKGDYDDQENVIWLADRVICLPKGNRFNGEIYCMGESPQRDPETELTIDNRDGAIEMYKNSHGIDKRIVTIHSPELDESFYEMNEGLLKNAKFRIVGYSILKTTYSDSKITVDNPLTSNMSKQYNSEVKSFSTSDNISGYSLVNFPMWIDGLLTTDFNTPSYIASYPIYPWHRYGSLSNQGKTEERKSVLKTKTLSNLRITLPSKYLDTPYNMITSNITLWNNQLDNSIKKIDVRDLWGIPEIVYKGTIDILLPYEGNGEGDEIGIRALNKATYDSDTIPPNWIQIPTDNYKYEKVWKLGVEVSEDHRYNKDSVPIQYKSTGHAVFAFNKLDNNTYEILPNISNSEDYGNESVSYPLSNTQYGEFKGQGPLVWLSDPEVNSYSGLHQHTIIVNDPILDKKVYNTDSDNNVFGYYYIIGELYRDNVLNRFGGTSEQALANNVWTTCGDTVYFNTTSRSNELAIDYIELIGDQGDTYYCRYDHLKTQPLGEGNVNNIVDIVSFMCETRINIDGRYDRNRGLESNLHITSNNFNLFNKVYSQKNNFFTGSYLRTDDLFSTKFPSQIMWSKTKTLGEEIDSWNNIIPTSVLDLDGDKGDLVSLTKYGNEIWAFQEEGISKILYNNRVQINASDGIPIEIANSGKVEGKVYLPYNYGCQNKWSIVEGTGGLYFIDNYNNAILNIGPDGSLVDVSATKGMVSWVDSFKDLSNYSWNPSNFNSIRSLYDPNTKDIYFTTKDEALAFNELIGKFTSFYSYDKVSNLFNIKGKTYQIREGEIWELQGGDDYNRFFSNDPNKYSLSIIANSEFSTDKIFDTVEFRTNDTSTVEYGKVSYYPFNTLKVENDYQSSETNTATLKKKFRTWRWQVGRDGKAGRDRIRNPWAKFTLEGNFNDELKVYDMNVIYYT